MGYVWLMAACGSCKRPFMANPNLVPSLNNVPFCQICVDAANPERIANGLEPITYHPDAYKEMDETEL